MKKRFPMEPFSTFLDICESSYSSKYYFFLQHCGWLHFRLFLNNLFSSSSNLICFIFSLSFPTHSAPFFLHRPTLSNLAQSSSFALQPYSAPSSPSPRQPYSTPSAFFTLQPYLAPSSPFPFQPYIQLYFFPLPSILSSSISSLPPPTISSSIFFLHRPT